MICIYYVILGFPTDTRYIDNNDYHKGKSLDHFKFFFMICLMITDNIAETKTYLVMQTIHPWVCEKQALSLAIEALNIEQNRFFDGLHNLYPAE